jgi:hypothetical protein
MSAPEIDIGTIRRNLSMIRGNLRELSRLVEGNVYPPTVVIINKLMKSTTALLNPSD